MSAVRTSAAVLFVNPVGEVLLRLRDDRPDLIYPNQWDLIGGAVERGETIGEAVVREVKEELGLDVQGLEYFGEYPSDVHNHVFLAPLALPADRLVLTEGQCIRYVTAARARALPLVPWVARVIEDFFYGR
jgi:8-oxo-dGTP diphosphatase